MFGFWVLSVLKRGAEAYAALHAWPWLLCCSTVALGCLDAVGDVRGT